MAALLAIAGAGHTAALVLVPLAGLYATLNVGVSGGPNHGEHPFIANVVHLVVFSMKAEHWPRPLFWAYFGVLIAATVFSLFIQGLRGGWTDRPVLAARLAMASAYAALTGMLAFGGR